MLMRLTVPQRLAEAPACKPQSTSFNTPMPLGLNPHHTARGATSTYTQMNPQTHPRTPKYTRVLVYGRPSECPVSAHTALFLAMLTEWPLHTVSLLLAAGNLLKMSTN